MFVYKTSMGCMYIIKPDGILYLYPHLDIYAGCLFLLLVVRSSFFRAHSDDRLRGVW